MKSIVLGMLVSACIATAAMASCKDDATEKKLADAAKSSFTKKCVSDAVGE